MLNADDELMTCRDAVLQSGILSDDELGEDDEGTCLSYLLSVCTTLTGM